MYGCVEFKLLLTLLPSIKKCRALLALSRRHRSFPGRRAVQSASGMAQASLLDLDAQEVRRVYAPQPPTMTMPHTCVSATCAA